MALLECPECKGKVSDKADFCPHCGYADQVPPAEMPASGNQPVPAAGPTSAGRTKSDVETSVTIVGLAIYSLVLLYSTTASAVWSWTAMLGMPLLLLGVSWGIELAAPIVPGNLRWTRRRSVEAAGYVLAAALFVLSRYGSELAFLALMFASAGLALVVCWTVGTFVFGWIARKIDGPPPANEYETRWIRPSVVIWYIVGAIVAVGVMRAINSSSGPPQPKGPMVKPPAVNGQK